MIKYPASIDTSLELPTVIDNFTPINGALLNNIRDAILAIENELGIKPSGIYTNVRTRIAAIEVVLGNLVSGTTTFVANGDLSGTTTNQTVIGLQGVSINATAPTDGYLLTYSSGDGYWYPAPGGGGGGSGSGDINTLISEVIGIKGLPITTAPTIFGENLSLNNNNEWQPILNTVHVDLFGAIADADGSQSAGIAAGTPNANAFEAAIRSLDPIKGGIIQLGFGRYRLERTVIVDRRVIIQGMGADVNFANTIIFCDHRVTAFRIGEGVNGITTTGGDDSGFGSTIRQLMIRAAAKDTVITSCDWNYATASAIIPDADAARFSLGQLISIAGANQGFSIARIKAATRSGFKTIVVTGADRNSSRGMIEGQYLTIGTAFTTLTRTDIRDIVPSVYSAVATYAIDDVVIPTSVNDHVYAVESGAGVGGTEPIWVTDGTTIASGGGVVFRDLGAWRSGIYQIATIVRMAVNAADDLVDAIVYARPSMYGRIKSKISSLGFTTLETDASNGISENLTGVDLRDASAGIDMRFQAKISNVIIYGFEGPAVAILTNGLSGQNANAWQINDLFTHTNRHAVVAHGQNSQAGTAIGVYGVQSLEWSIIEDTQAGNTWVGSHADGGFGFLVRDGCSATIIGAYHETGTFSSYSTITHSVGGTGSTDYGGVSDVTGTRNRITVGDLEVHTHSTTMDPDGHYLSFYHPGTNSTLPTSFRRSTSGQEATTGWSVLSGSGNRQTAFAVSDSDSPAGYGAGTFWLPRGFLLGSTSVNTLNDLDNAIRLYRTDDEPAAQDFDALSGTALWRIGDINFVTGKGSEISGLLRCIRGGQGTTEWKPNTVTTLNSIMRLPTDDTYWYLATSIGSPPNQTGAAEPASSASITDGDITWTRQAGTSAIWERVGTRGGQISVAMSDADKTLTDIQSSYEIINVTGALTNDRNLRLPVPSNNKYAYQRTIIAAVTGGNILVDIAGGASPITVISGTSAIIIFTTSVATLIHTTFPIIHELNLASGLFTTNSSSFTRSGGRKIDMSSFPAAIGALTRTVIFTADIDMTGGATSVEVQLYDITNSAAITGTNLTSSSTTNTTVTSAALTVGSSAGNVRNDVAAQYELQFKMNGGGGSDAVFLTNAKLNITYA